MHSIHAANLLNRFVTVLAAMLCAAWVVLVSILFKETYKKVGDLRSYNPFEITLFPKNSSANLLLFGHRKHRSTQLCAVKLE
jgi:hypothetical protein